MKNLYEFTALLNCGVVVAADNEAAARKAIETWGRAWVDTGDFLGVSDIELSCTRYPDPNCDLKDLAHEIV